MYLSPFIPINSFVAGFMEGGDREVRGWRRHRAGGGGEIRGFPKWMQTLVINLITHTYIEGGEETHRGLLLLPHPLLICYCFEEEAEDPLPVEMAMVAVGRVREIPWDEALAAIIPNTS